MTRPKVPKSIAVVGAVIVRNGAILCAQRGPSMSLPLTWEFPGGKIDPGESPKEALVREIREELNADVRVGERVTTTRHTYEFATIDLTTFYCSMPSGELTLSEHTDVVWLPQHELDTLDWAPADIPAVQKVMADPLP